LLTLLTPGSDPRAPVWLEREGSAPGDELLHQGFTA